MALRDKLHALDHNFFPGTRDAEEDAETFLRRVAASRAISPAQAGDVMAALREYLGVEPEEEQGDDEKDEGEEQKDEADEASKSGESDEADSDDKKDDDEKDDDKDE
jgi:hypothetical protein